MIEIKRASKASPKTLLLVAGAGIHDAAKQVLCQENQAREASEGSLSLVGLSFFRFFQTLTLARPSQVVREHYLRDDIYCGALSCTSCDTSAARLSPPESASIIIVDTNVVLNQVSDSWSLTFWFGSFGFDDVVVLGF